MTTLPGGQTVGANQISYGTNNSLFANAPLSLTPTPTYTGPALYQSSGKLTSAVPTTPPKPTSVVSTAPAVKQSSNIQSTVNNQNTVNTNAQNQLYSTSNGFVTPYGLSQGAKPVQPGDPANTTQNNTTTNTGGTTSTQNGAITGTSAEDKIANAPDEGMQEAYNLQTGVREDQPIGTLPSGFSSLNPNVRNDVTNSVSDTNGVTYKQFADGTYGRFDESGNYSQATSQSFQAAQAAAAVQTKIQSILSGTFQLPPNQQAQLDGLSAKYSGLIQQQETSNANSTGATTIAENLYGMGNTLTGKSQITQTINDGLQKIASLQNELSGQLATMTDAFQKDDMSQLKDSYDAYQTNQKAIQAEIDKQVAYTQSQQDKQDASFQAYADAAGKKYPGALTGLETTRQQVDQALQKDPNYIRDQQKQSVALQASTAKLQSSTLSLTPDEVKTWADQAAQDPTILSRFGYGSSPNKEAVLSAIADGIKNGTYSNLAGNKVDLKYASNASTQNTLKYLGSLTGIGGQPGNLDQLVNLSNNIERTSFPPINSVEFSALLNSGDPNIAAYGAMITEVSDQIAKILQGGGTGSSTSDAKLSQANAILNKNFTKDQIVAVAHTLKTLLANRKSSLIGNNPFLQEYSDNASASSSSTQSSSTDNSGSNNFAESWS